MKTFNPLVKKGFDEVGEGSTAANGLPEGGTAGQVLSKIDGANFNAEWTDATGGTATDNAKHFRKDIIDRTLCYSATNESSDLDSDNRWKIVKMIQLDNDNSIRTILTATGAWSNRLSLTYTTKFTYEV